MFALAALEDVSGAFRRAGGRLQGLLKPFMLIGSVIRHNIDDDVDAGIVCVRNQLIELRQIASTPSLRK